MCVYVYTHIFKQGSSISLSDYTYPTKPPFKALGARYQGGIAATGREQASFCNVFLSSSYAFLSEPFLPVSEGDLISFLGSAWCHLPTK